MTESAQMFPGIHDIPTYTNLLGKSLRLTVAIPLALGGTATVVATALTLDSGNARTIFLVLATITLLCTGIGALIPRTRPDVRFRLGALNRALRPRPASTEDPGSALTPPKEVIGNLRFTDHGVYADFILTGLRTYLQPFKRRLAAANLHAQLIRELPSGSWLYGLSVPQDQRQLLRSMLHGHADKPRWATTVHSLAPLLQDETPSTRIFWLSIPVDAGRAGHSPAGQLARLQNWLAGRDTDDEDTLIAYQRLAHDVITSIPPDYAAAPVPADFIDWFWRHNLFTGGCDLPLPAGSRSREHLTAADFPVADFDEGDQAHRRALPSLLNWLPSWSKVLRISSRDHWCADSYQAIVPVTSMPIAGIKFPGSEILDALDDIDTGARFDWAIPITKPAREFEHIRNDRAKGNIYDQFEHRGDIRNGLADLRSRERQLAEYSRLLDHNADEQPLQTAFFIAVRAAGRATVDYSLKRLREELQNSGGVSIRHYRGAQQRLWSVFNPGVPFRISGVDQFTQPTTSVKWGCFSPITSHHLGTSTGPLIGFSQINANHSAVLVDLPATSRRNRNPIWVASGAPGYGKSYATKGYTSDEVERGAQAFIMDPGTEWARAFAHVPNKAVIDLAGNDFGCDPLRIFPVKVAGGYWMDYMVPMMGLDPDSIGVDRLRTLMSYKARTTLGITSTAALIRYMASIQAPLDGPDDRPQGVKDLAADLRPVLVKLKSWETYDFTQAIFDEHLPTPDLASLDVSIWQMGSLDMPTADEMSDPVMFNSLSDRKRASVAICGMLFRLARVTFFSNEECFGLIVLEEAAAVLNSRAGAADVHLFSRRIRKVFTGLVIITQDPIADLALMGDQFVTQQLIMPFESQELARKVARRAGIRLDEYPDIEDQFLAEPDPEEMRDPAAPIPTATEGSRRGREGYGFLVDEFRRVGPIRVARRTNPAQHKAFDTTPGGSAA